MSYRQPFSRDYQISQRFGEKITDPDGHKGIDYMTPIGTPILASESGTVISAGWDNYGYGYRVVLKHPDGNSTLYAHLKAVAVRIGQKVAQGEEIGYSGNTGNSTGPHLHFEARNSENKAFDPILLPLQNFADVVEPEPITTDKKLKEPDQLGEAVQIVCTYGAYGWSHDFGKRYTVFPQGTKLHFTGQTAERLGYTYCECYPEPAKYWVAVHDGDTQILDNQF